MPNHRLSMRKIREVLRLHHEAHLSRRAIGRCLSISPATVGEYLTRAQAVGLTWPLSDDLDEAALEARLFPVETYAHDRPEPDWNTVHRELRAKGVTLRLLWHEYKEQHPEGYRYSWFCEHYRRWRGQLDVVMRQTHRAGEKLFVDYAGQTVPITDPATGTLREAQIFVAVLGCSNYTYAEATWTQRLEDWIGAHERAFMFFGGTPEIVVPDNLKAAVHKAHRYEPDLNPTYVELAAHYGTVVIPARARKPRDKAKVEAGVGHVERWILARLRHRPFFALTELNRAIRALLKDLNEAPFQKLEGSRRSLFEELDRPALRPLPSAPYELALWKQALVPMDYHVEVDGHYYSVPHALVRRRLEVRLTQRTVECFYRGRRVASHARSTVRGAHTTVHAHRPKAHRLVAEWNFERIMGWAEHCGGATGEVIVTLLEESAHREQGMRSALAVIRLERSYGADRLEAAARRALALGVCSYKSLASILKTGLDGQALPDAVEEPSPPLVHANLRGGTYYR